MKKWKIFISHGTAFTPVQERFYAKFREFIEARGCEWTTVGQNMHGVRQPVELARDAIAACDGAVIIAFRRIEILHGTDKPGGAALVTIDGRILPTVWNHLEGAMAYAHHLPLLVIVESGVHREGMLSKRFEWDALEIDITSKTLASEEFQQRFDHWISFVERRSLKKTEPDVEAGKIPIVRIIKSLTASEIKAIIAAAFAVLSLVATAAYYIGKTASH